MPATLDPPTPHCPPTVDDGTRREFLAAGAGALLIGVAGCGSDDGGSGGETERTVRTSKGPVRVPAKPKRVVVTSGALAGYLYALDAPVVAADTRILGDKPDASGFPSLWSEQARKRGTKALPGGDSIGIEAIAAAKPDLIIGGGQGLPGFLAEQSYDKLSRIAPTVLVSRSLKSWQAELDVVAGVLGARDRGRELVAGYERRAREVRRAITLPEQPTAVIYESGGKPFVLFDNAILPRLLGEVGFKLDRVRAKAGNPRAYQPGGDAFNLSLERLGDVATAPTLFVITLAGVPSAELEDKAVYRDLPAFKSGDVHDLPPISYRPDYLAAMRTLDALQREFG